MQYNNSQRDIQELQVLPTLIIILVVELESVFEKSPAGTAPEKIPRRIISHL